MGTTLHTLHPPEGHRKRKKRVGRGPGSRRGKTATRGSKGQKARNNVRVGFEGGQNPIHRRVPKRGFININRIETHGINVSRLEAAFNEGDTVNLEALRERGLIPKKADLVKVLGHGELKKKLNIDLHAVSASARQKIEAVGGTIKVVVGAPEGESPEAASAPSDEGGESA